MSFEGFPFIIGWELTLGCNLRCNHCGSAAGLPRENELTLEESLTICDQFPALLVQEVDFTGGEPLLRPDWALIADHLRKKGIPTKMITNGLELDAETISLMQSVGIAGIGVSVDGLEETHDYVRGRAGVFRRVLKGIEEGVKAGIPVGVITTAHALNIKELPNLLEHLSDIGVHRWQIQPMFPTGRACSESKLRLTDEAYLQLGDFVKEYEAKARSTGLDLLMGDSYGYFTDYDTREPPWRGCPAGLCSCGITSDGKIKGCLSLPDALIEGDLRKNDLWDIWFDPESFVYTRQPCENDLGANCASCDKAAQCRGGCSAMSYGSTGTFHNDPYCFYRIRNKIPTKEGV